MKFQNHYNHYGIDTENFEGRISETIPNEGMTAREVLDRSMAGLPLDGAKVPIYRGDQIFPEFDRLDHSEQFEIVQKVKKEMKRRQVESHQEGKRRYDEAIRSQVLEELKKAQEEKIQTEVSEGTGNSSE